MVIKKIFVIFIGLWVLHANAHGIKNIKIDGIGLSSDKSEATASGCKDFKPTFKQVKLYFLNAYPVDHYLFAQTFYSPCYAKGIIEYDDGNQGDWILRSSGIAEISWERSGRTILFYGHNKWFDPFAETYDENGV